MTKSHNSKPKDFSKHLLCSIEDGGEYFTVKSTGRSGMSQRGLARFVGKHPSSIWDWVNKVRKADPLSNQLPEPLKLFAGKTLTLLGYTDPQGRDILEDRFCSALVEYFAWWAQDAEANVQAKRAFGLIRDLGMRLFIHQKTGWHPVFNSKEFEQLREIHEQRLTARNILKDELRPELMAAVKEWQVANRASRKIYSQTHDALNECIQGLKSREIKESNNLPDKALIRDYYDTRPLIDYGAISRFAGNLIRFSNIHPVEAVKLTCACYFPPSYAVKPLHLVENIHKVSKILQAKHQEMEPSEKIPPLLPG
ncbi:hypothetical protein [Microcoleus sp. FACHB-672]|uniref:hypothetical protein n=1 Tax=Microcoleus sp. FACHB-672 TaxID=2692825 RepID=UPI0016828303|nr:hypothetical protein [Microcoleus sp. FACHB-672]MBD2042227.1 hypothetical protein [Microcoleus sp. FACHB-672]